MAVTTPDGAVEDPGLALVVVVAELGHLVADPEHPAAVAAFGLSVDRSG